MSVQLTPCINHASKGGRPQNQGRFLYSKTVPRFLGDFSRILNKIIFVYHIARGLNTQLTASVFTICIATQLHALTIASQTFSKYIRVCQYPLNIQRGRAAYLKHMMCYKRLRHVHYNPPRATRARLTAHNREMRERVPERNRTGSFSQAKQPPPRRRSI